MEMFAMSNDLGALFSPGENLYVQVTWLVRNPSPGCYEDAQKYTRVSGSPSPFHTPYWELTVTLSGVGRA